MIQEIVLTTVEGFIHNAWYLIAGILVAACMEVFLDRKRAMATLSRSGWAGVALGTAVGALTPLCSCGTAAVILALIASGVPWPPVVSFLVSSPLMSPSAYMLTAGVLGTPMANAKLVTAIALGLVSGGAALLMERRGVLVNTAAGPADTGAGASPGSCDASPGCASSQAPPTCCDTPAAVVQAQACCAAPSTFARFARALRSQSEFVLKYFVLFSFLGAVTQALVPASWVQGLFGQGRSYSVVSAALLGVPLYMSSAASIPFTASLMQMGMGKGAALAFLTAGPGTHLGALAAVGMVAPRRVWWLYLGTVFFGSIAAGFLYGIM